MMSEPIAPAPNPAPNPAPDPPANGNVPDTSTIFGVSVRAWMALMIIATVCIMSSLGRNIPDPLYSLALVASGAYLGKVIAK